MLILTSLAIGNTIQLIIFDMSDEFDIIPNIILIERLEDIDKYNRLLD